MIDQLGEDWKAYKKVEDALQSIAESAVDTGGGLGSRDYWVRINGVEWSISMRRSDRQLSLDAAIAAQQGKDE